MIRFGMLLKMNKVYISLLGIVIFHIQLIHCQDLKDTEHTLKFADYLFKTKQYVLASEEYERLAFIDSTDLSIKYRLIQSYRFSERPKVALEKFTYFFNDNIDLLNSKLSEEYVKNLILEKDNQKAIHFLDKTMKLDIGTIETYQLGCILLERQWDNAFNFALKHSVTESKKNADLHVLAIRSKQLNYKKPYKAALFSSIIPGTGKMYTKNWKDGIISLMFVGVNAWQAYRGFNKYGKNSVYGWVFASLSAGFYAGNIFGSYKSAKKYNKKIDDEIYNETWHLMVDDF